MATKTLWQHQRPPPTPPLVNPTARTVPLSTYKDADNDEVCCGRRSSSGLRSARRVERHPPKRHGFCPQSLILFAAIDFFVSTRCWADGISQAQHVHMLHCLAFAKPIVHRINPKTRPLDSTAPAVVVVRLLALFEARFVRTKRAIVLYSHSSVMFRNHA